MQKGLQQPGKINAILVAGKPSAEPPSKDASKKLNAALKPSLEDLGFSLTRFRLTFREEGAPQEEVIYDYLSFTSDKMIFDDRAAIAAEQAFARDHVQPVFTYLATAIGKASNDPKKTGIKDISYSMITAID